MIKQVISILFLVSLCSVVHPMNKRKLDTDRGAHRAKRVDTGNVQNELERLCGWNVKLSDTELLAKIHGLVQQGADVDKQDRDGKTPFYKLLLEGKQRKPSFLITFIDLFSEKIDFSRRFGPHSTSYMGSAVKEHQPIEVLKKIITCLPEGFYSKCLHESIRLGRVDLFSLLIDKSNLIEMESVINHAVIDCKYKEFLSLIENKAKKSLLQMSQDQNLDLMREILFNRIVKKDGICERIEYLASKGFSFNVNHLVLATLECPSDRVIDSLLKQGVPVDGFNDKGFTALQAAAIKNHSSVVNTLLRHNAQIGTICKDNQNCLHIAASQGHYEFIQTVLRHPGISDLQKKEAVNARLKQSGRTPLFVAFRNHRSTMPKSDKRKGLSTDCLIKTWSALLPYADLTIKSYDRTRFSSEERPMTIFENLYKYKEKLSLDYSKLRQTLEQ